MVPGRIRGDAFAERPHDPLVTGHQLRTTLVVLGIAVATVFLLQALGALIAQFAPAVVTLLLAWIINLAALRPVTLLRRLGLPRWMAATVVYLVFVTLVVLGSIYLLPPLFAQLGEAIGALTDMAAQLPEALEDLRSQLHRLGVPDDQIQQLIDGATTSLTTLGQDAGSAILGQTTALLGGLGLALITLIISFNILLSWDQTVRRLRNALPPLWRDRFDRGRERVDTTFGNWMAGQFVASAAYGAFVILVMSVAGVPYGVLVGVTAAILMFLPLIGNAYGVIVPTLIAGFTRIELALWVGIPLLVLTLAIENVLKPRVVGSSIGVSPVIVILSVIVGGLAAGFWGILFGIPLGALLWSFVRWIGAEFLEERRVAAARKALELAQVEAAQPPVGASPSPGGAAP